MPSVSVSEEGYEWLVKQSSEWSIKQSKKVSIAEVIDQMIKDIAEGKNEQN